MIRLYICRWKYCFCGKNLKLTLVFQTSNIYKEWNYFFYGKNRIRTTSNLCRFSFRNKHIWERLNIIGCTPNKSLILQFPEDTIFGKKILIYDFIRGYCDGDGCLYFNEKTSHTAVSIVGTFLFYKRSQVIWILLLFKLGTNLVKIDPIKHLNLDIQVPQREELLESYMKIILFI